ncbi:MAG: GntP family permease [Lachnospiraceae bacterium]
MNTTVMILGIIVAFLLLGYMCMKGWSVFVSAPICALIIAITSGMDPFSAITEQFLPGTGNYLAQWFLLFMLGALFGKIMEVSGAAASIARSVTNLIGAKNACIAVIIATSLMTYGGISLFVVVFVIYPFAVGLFQEADLPKRLLPGCIATGAFSFTAIALPGSPQNQNVLPTTYFGTTPTAAPVLGIIIAIYILGASILYMNWRAKKARANGEHFVPSAKDLDIIEANKNQELPNIVIALLPLITVVGTIVLMKWETMVCLLIGIILSIVLYYNRLKNNFIETINQGAMNSMTAILNTSLTVGLGTVIKASSAFAIICEAIDKLSSGNGLVYEFISINVLAGVTGSASGGLSIALETLSQRLLATGINPEILHRVAAISANGLDSMPWCGAVMTMLAVCGLTHKDSYKDVAVVNIAITMSGAILAIILGSLGVC